MLPPEVHDSFGHYIFYRKTLQPAEESIKFQGNIYLIVDGGVYSSAEMFAVFAKDSNFATVIGQSTGGDGIGTDPWIEMLPNSGYLFRLTFMMGTTADGRVNEEHKTMPDYDAPARVVPDQCISKVLELEGLEIIDD